MRMVYKGKKPFFCTHCHGIFSRSFSLKRHTCIETMRVHNPDQKSYRSAQCGARFVSNSETWRIKHSSAHAGEKPINPETAYEASFTLGKKPFCCTECIAAFKQASQVKTHMRSHTGERMPCACTQ